jgi:hypothetical protein
MKPTTKRKLKLSTETLRVLSRDVLRHVDGGYLVTTDTLKSCDHNLSCVQSACIEVC